MDKLGISLDTCNYEYVEKIAKQKRAIVFDRTSQVKPLLHCGIDFDEIKDNSPSSVLDKTIKWMKSGQADLIFGLVKLVDQPSIANQPKEKPDLYEEMNKAYEVLNQKLAQLLEVASEDTLFMISSYCPERPSRMADRLDFRWKPAAPATDSQAPSKDNPSAQAPVSEPAYHLNNTLFLFAK